MRVRVRASLRGVGSILTSTVHSTIRRYIQRAASRSSIGFPKVMRQRWEHSRLTASESTGLEASEMRKGPRSLAYHPTKPSIINFLDGRRGGQVMDGQTADSSCVNMALAT